MDDILNRPIVLVLNRNWQAINVRTPQQAFVQMATDVATALDIDGENMVPARWAEWIKLPVRENDYAVRTPSGPIRVPAVIVLSRFAKVPKRRPKFSARAIWARDGGQCQYTGANLRPSEGNIDHVLPRSRGGKTSWEMREIARASQIEIKTEIAPDLPEVSIDLQRMDYVITNLITNAIKYSPKGTEILVRMGLGKLRTTEPGVRFSVTDQGPGIPMDYQEHIFERFYRVPGTKKSGAGLGLSIAREVVVMHQGEIGVISQVGIGSEFFFILPSISGQVSEAASVEKNDA